MKHSQNKTAREVPRDLGTVREILKDSLSQVQDGCSLDSRWDQNTPQITTCMYLHYQKFGTLQGDTIMYNTSSGGGGLNVHFGFELTAFNY